VTSAQRAWMRRVAEVVGGVAAVAGAVVWLSGGCEERIPPGLVRAPGTPVPEDATLAVVRREVEPVREWASGTVASARRTAVASRVLARIEAVAVRAGSDVERGDVLVRLDARDLEARVREAEDALRAARSRLELARTEARRAARLLDEGVGTRQRVDETQSALRAARAEVGRQEQALEQARAARSYAELRSPVSGRVIDRLAEPGDMAVPGTPLLRLYDPSLLRVEAPVRESLAVDLSVGQPLAVRVDAADLEVEGAVDEIVPFAEPGARTLLVKVRLPDTGRRVLAGMFARVAVPAGPAERLLVPGAAVRHVGQLELVRVVGGEGFVERRYVTTAPVEEEGVLEVLSGLEEGERVLVEAPPPSALQGEVGQLR